MRLTVDDVRHVATLARLGMSDEEAEILRDQLSHILDQFQVLEGVNTDDVDPTGHSADLDSVLRADEAEPSRPRADILANAPNTEGNFVRVRAVLE